MLLDTNQILLSNSILLAVLLKLYKFSLKKYLPESRFQQFLVMYRQLVHPTSFPVITNFSTSNGQLIPHDFLIKDERQMTIKLNVRNQRSQGNYAVPEEPTNNP